MIRRGCKGAYQVCDLIFLHHAQKVFEVELAHHDGLDASIEAKVLKDELRAKSFSMTLYGKHFP